MKGLSRISSVLILFFAGLHAWAQSATSPFVGSWDWTDTASDGSSYTGSMTISQAAASGSVTWTWIGGWSGTGTSTGSTLTLDGAEPPVHLTAHWVGVLDPTGRRIDGTWTQSDGQVGTFTATRQGPPPTLTCPSAAATTNLPYFSAFTASGGTPPYTSYGITTGSLPPGLTLNSSTGAVTGTPTTAGTFPFTGSVTDSAGQSGTANCSISVESCQGTSQWSFPALTCSPADSSCFSPNAPPNTNGACLLYSTPEDASGVSFEVWCGNFVVPVCSHCFAFYRRDHNGARELAGKCWFGGGVNSIHLYYTDDGAGAAACFASSVWLNEQQDRTEEDPPLPPNTQWTTGDGKIDRWIYKHHVDLEKTDIFVTKDMLPVFRLDPTGGPNFNDLLPVVPDVPFSPLPSTLLATRTACDLNGDGKCDAQDQAIFTSALGSCMGSPLYNARADIDGDGCVTQSDAKNLFPIPGDINFDGVVNCTDVKIVTGAFGKKLGQTGFDARADVNLDGVVDIRDLSFVSQHLPTGTRCQ